MRRSLRVSAFLGASAQQACTFGLYLFVVVVCITVYIFCFIVVCISVGIVLCFIVVCIIVGVVFVVL